jgi:F0F1-type ATP synthase membrane subunit c/vacuolar-type H+-ATPase subunit K
VLLIITAVKILVIGTCMITLAGAAIGTGVLFAGYTLSAAKNPEEAENLFNTTLMAFALIETFVFLSFLVAAIAYIL